MREAEYDSMAAVEQHHWWFVGRRERAIRLSRDYGIRGRILDLGCGTGANLEAYARLGLRVVGVDLSFRAARYASRSGAVTVADATRLPFPAGSFDAVLAFDLFEHLPDDRAAFAEAGRVLRPGGMLLLTVPACAGLFGSHDRALHHVRRYGCADLLRAARAAGFAQPRHVGYYGGLVFPLLMTWRLLHKTLIAGEGGSDVGRPLPEWVNRLLLGIMRIEHRCAPLLGGTLMALWHA